MNVAICHWTAERIDMLKSLWTGGVSCSKIADRVNEVSFFAGSISRNAVIGKARRLGLEKRRIGVNPLKEAELARNGRKPRKSRKSRANPQRISALNFTHRTGESLPPTFPTEPPPATLEETSPVAQRCTIAELTEANCHWPIGDPGKPDFAFCGGVAIEGLPYCVCHARIAYVPMRPRQPRMPDRLGSFYRGR